MFSVKNHTFEMLVEKQSKFIAHLMPYSEYAETLEVLEEEHPKARHFVTAFRYINEFDQVVEGSSDDGEPKGTSGRPTLSVLQGHKLINVAVVVVRYFGGTKLGTGGLVRAYSNATNLVVDAAELQIYKKEKSISISTSYSNMGRVEYALGQHEVKIVEKSFGNLEVTMQIMATAEVLKQCCSEIERIIKIEEK